MKNELLDRLSSGTTAMVDIMESKETPYNIPTLISDSSAAFEELLTGMFTVLLEREPDKAFLIYEASGKRIQSLVDELLNTTDATWYRKHFKEDINSFFPQYQKSNPSDAGKIFGVAIAIAPFSKDEIATFLASFGKRDEIPLSIVTDLVGPILKQLCRNVLKDPKNLKGYLSMICEYDKKVLLVVEKEQAVSTSEKMQSDSESERDLLVLNGLHLYLQNIIDTAVHYPIGFENQSTQSS